MEIRQGRLDDFEQVAALIVTVRPYVVGARHRLRQTLTELESGRLAAFAAEDDGQVIGWAILTPADWLSAANAYVLNLMVHPDRRRSGVGTRLMEACDDWLERLPSSFLQAYADEESTPFALAAGFTAGSRM